MTDNLSFLVYEVLTEELYLSVAKRRSLDLSLIFLWSKVSKFEMVKLYID